jgi:hypothetical protein
MEYDYEKFHEVVPLHEVAPTPELVTLQDA